MPLRYHARHRIANEVCTEIPGVDDAEMLQDWQKTSRYKNKVLPCCLIFHRNILNLIPLELVDRKPWNVWKALVLVQRNGVPSSNSWPRCLG